jgi:hypothetical protein
LRQTKNDSFKNREHAGAFFIRKNTRILKQRLWTEKPTFLHRHHKSLPIETHTEGQLMWQIRLCECEKPKIDMIRRQGTRSSEMKTK